MINASKEALDDFNYCINIEDVLEDVKEALIDKAA